MKSTRVAIYVLTVFFIITLSLPAQTKETENVFVVIIDGVRNEEAFEDPDHQYIPYLWNELRPQGTIYTEFYLDQMAAYTTPADSAYLTGQWHWQTNLEDFGFEFNDVRPEAPTFFEEYRKHFGAPIEECLIVSGKFNNMQLDRSIVPGYGPDYRSLAFQGGSDDETYALLGDKLAEHHPRLVFCGFRDADWSAHGGNWANYTANIIHMDWLVYRIWTELIQGDPFYADKTTMIVASHHGRNDDTVGFNNHGGMSHQNRHVPFLAIGPDTPAGVELSERRYHRDLAPTIGEFLDFPTHFAHGQTLTGLFEPGLDPDPRLRVIQKDPRITAYEGLVAVAYSQNDPSDSGNDNIYVIKKGPDDPDFGEPILISNPAAGRWAFAPSISANHNGLHVAWLDGRALNQDGERWSVYFRNSFDWGETWEDEQLIATSTFETAPPSQLSIMSEPELITTASGEMLITVRFIYPEMIWGNGGLRKTWAYTSQNGGLSWNQKLVGDNGNFPRQFHAVQLTKSWEAAAVCIDLCPSTTNNRHTNWEIVTKVTYNGGSTWKNVRRLTYDNGCSMMPRLAYNGSRLLCVWYDRPVDGSDGRLCVRPSWNKGKNWGSTITVPSTGAAWAPDVEWNPSIGKFVMAWTDFETGMPDLKYSTSSTGQSWSAPALIVPGQLTVLKRNAQLAHTNGVLYAAWEQQDPYNGNWLIETGTID